MDPNEALGRIREALDAFNNDEDGDWDPLDLVEPLESLDSWLTRDGFLPDDWARVFCPVHNGGATLNADGTCARCGDRHPSL